MLKQMGKYKGLPVYLTMGTSFDELEHEREVFFVFEGRLYYHGYIVGELENNRQLKWFSEEIFEKAKGVDGPLEKMLAKVTKSSGNAETALQSAERPVMSDVEQAAADTSIVDDFMANWQENIDYEIARLKLVVAQMEDEVRAIN